MLIEVLDPVKINSKEVQRFSLKTPHGPCVIFEKQSACKKAAFDQEGELDKYLSSQIFSEPAIQVKEGLGVWSESPLYKFNCHTLSIGSFVGIGPDLWIEGIASQLTLKTNPLEKILNQYFEEVMIGNKNQFFSLSNCKEIKEDDVVVLSRKHKRVGIEFCHSARVKFIDGKMYLLSKYGENEIFLTGLEHLYFEYQLVFSEFSVYRWQGSQF